MTRMMYGAPKKVDCVSIEQLNSFRIALVKEYQAGNGAAAMTLLNTEYTAEGRQYQDLMGFIAKATESTMKNHKYFAGRELEEDDLQEVLTRVLGALKTLRIDTINADEAVGAYLISTIRYNISKYLRDLLRLENRGLPAAEWTSFMDVEIMSEEDTVITDYVPSTPDEIYEIESEEETATYLINKLGTKRQKEAALLAKAGKSYPEIAAMMNINEGTVKVNIAVLKAKLAAYHARSNKR
jgi:RNA polymerase sigma factor (sigma-70 family)